MPDGVCIVGLKCHDHLLGKERPRFLGGVERQLTVLGRSLVARGRRVAFVVFDEPGVATFAGEIKIEGAYPAQGTGHRLTRFLRRAMAMYAAVQRVDSQCLLQMGAGLESGMVALCALLQRRRFVFLLASDADAHSDLPLLHGATERIAYRFALRQADVVVAQTVHQQQLLAANFRIRAPVCVLPSEGIPQSDSPCETQRVLWIGRMDPAKRVDWLLDVAEALPDVGFDLVGSANADSDYSAAVEHRASQLPNVVRHGKVDEAALHGLYQRSAMLCCTSEVEGFPTTFIEAWSLGIPVVTTFDPDGVVGRRGLGEVVGSQGELVASVRKLLDDVSLRQGYGDAALVHFRSTYHADACLGALEQAMGLTEPDAETTSLSREGGLP